MTSFHLSFQTRATEGRSHRENVGRRAIACRKSRPPPREDRNRKVAASALESAEANRGRLAEAGQRTDRDRQRAGDGSQGIRPGTLTGYILRIRLLIQIMEFSIAQLVWCSVRLGMGAAPGPCPIGLRTFEKKCFSASISQTSMSFAPLRLSM